MTSELAVNALANALALRGGVATIVHSDRGSQLRSHGYVGTPAPGLWCCDRSAAVLGDVGVT